MGVFWAHTGAIGCIVLTLFDILPTVGCGIPQAPEDGVVQPLTLSTQLGAQAAVLCLSNGTFVLARGALCTMVGWSPAPQDVNCGDAAGIVFDYCTITVAMI